MLPKVILLQLAAVALYTQAPIASSDAPPHCPTLSGGFEDLHTGDAVTLSLNCSSATLMPIITLETVESFSVNLGMLSVNYICNSSDAQIEPTGTILEDAVNPGTITVSASFSEGTECTFYGCYRTFGIPFSSSLAIQPTPCVIDINECEQGDHNCDVNAECSNTVGSFECNCDVGFTGSGTNCDDIDECEQDHNCDVNAECSNTVGSFECRCNDGFTGNGTDCYDINECEQGVHNCDVNAECSNTVGSFECRCNAGFTGNGTHCDDIDECERDHNCDVNSHCKNTVGSFDCRCIDGFTGNGTNCYDIDECDQVGHNCDKNATCNNTIGSFECICDDGFTGNGTNCDDIDECERDHNCDVNAECSNTVGSFECRCDAGFTGSGAHCYDINDCEQGVHNCDVNAECSNTVGSFECRCNDGFTGNGTNCDVASSDVSDYVQFVTVAVVIFVTSVATLVLLGIAMYIRKVKKRQHTVWSEMNKHFKKTMKEMKVDFDFEPVEPHTTLPYSPSFLSYFDILVVDSISTEDGAVIDHKIKEHILESSANEDTGDSDCHDEDYESMDLPNERPSVQTGYIVQAHNQGSGDTQEKDTGYVYTDTLSPDSNDHSTFAQTEALEYYDINSEHDFAASSSGQYSDSYIGEPSISNTCTNELLVPESSLDWSVVWQDQSSISFPET